VRDVLARQHSLDVLETLSLGNTNSSHNQILSRF
jgi:hypothetical protein